MSLKVDRLFIQMFGRIPSLRIEYLPQTVRDLLIGMSRQRFKLSTRAFPKESVVIGLQYNQIYGTPDLTCLPIHLQILNLEMNLLIGPINLCQLPPRITEIFLGRKSIHQQVVWYGNLPESLRTISLTNNRIGAARSLHKEF